MGKQKDNVEIAKYTTPNIQRSDSNTFGIYPGSSIDYTFTQSSLNTSFQSKVPLNSSSVSLVAKGEYSHTSPGGLADEKHATASIIVKGTTVNSWDDIDETWRPHSSTITSYYTQNNRTISGDVKFKCEAAKYNVGYRYTGQIRNMYVLISYECPYFTVTTTAPNGGGTVSGGGETVIEQTNKDYTRTITAAPSTNYHFVKWTFSGGASGTSTNASHSITYKDSTIGAHSKAITATATFAKNPRVYVKAIDADTGAAITGFLTGSDTATDKWYTIGATASRTARTTVANGDRSAVYEFAGWKIYKGNTSSGTATATSSSAQYSSTFNSSDYSSGVCDSNGETTWVAQYRRLYFLEVTKSPSNLSYVVKNKTGTTLSSSGDGMDTSRARYAIPSDGCTITMTVTNPRFGIKSSDTGMVSNTYGTSTLNGAVLNITPAAAQSTAIVNLVSEQLYWQLTISGNTGYTLSYDGVQQTNSYIAATGKTHVATIQYGQSGPLIDGTYLIPVDYSLSMLANENTGYDATIKLDGNTVAYGSSGHRQYTLSANTADHTIAITTSAAYYDIYTSVAFGNDVYDTTITGNITSSTEYGQITLQGNLDTLRGVMRHETVFAIFNATPGYMIETLQYKGRSGSLWYNAGAVTQCVVENITSAMDIRANVQINTEETYTVNIVPPRFGRCSFYLLSENSHVNTVAEAVSGQTDCVQLSPLMAGSYQGQLQALYSDEGVPYAFGCDIQRATGSKRYLIDVLNVSGAGGGLRWANSVKVQLPRYEDATVTFYALYRKNHIDIPVVSNDVLRHVQSREIYVDDQGALRAVREVYVDLGAGTPCCVWERADDNPCGLVTYPTLLYATDGAMFEDETAASLFDGGYHTREDMTKWYSRMPSDGTPLIAVCDLGFTRTINAYTLVTANDAASVPSYNPKSWRLYGSNDCSNWAVLHNVQDDNTLQAANYTPYTFYFVNARAYRYYKFEVISTGSNWFQLAELLLGKDLEPLPVNGLRQS